jgi:hypothetical protein
MVLVGAVSLLTANEPVDFMANISSLHAYVPCIRCRIEVFLAMQEFKW